MERGQAHTLEGFTAALLLITGVIFALQATAVTPLSASTSNQHIQNQQQLTAEDLLAAAATNGSLRDSVVYWDTTARGFYDATRSGYYSESGPPTDFGAMLDRAFKAERIAFNVHVRYPSGNGFSEQKMVFMGSPSDNSVSASRFVTLYNDTEMTSPSDEGTTVAETDGFYVSDGSPGTELYAVVEVHIVVWRM